VLLEGMKESHMNASGDNGKRNLVQISQSLLPWSLYCVLHYSALCSKTSDERDGRMLIRTARTTGIGQGIVGAQQPILRRVDRKKVNVVLLVVPD